MFGWAQKSWDLSAYKGQSVQFRFRVATDGGVSSEAFVDDISVTTDGVAGTVDDVESGAGAWTAKGFSIIERHDGQAGPGLLLRREPRLQRLRRDAEDRPVQLRLGHDEARLGGALPVPERHARLVRQR